MRTWKSILLVCLLALSAAAPCRAQDNARRFLAAMEAYKAENFTAAIADLETIARSGVRNGELFYNIGNAHLKNHDLGRAILWYERALKLLPNDPDLRFNYNYARSLTRDAVDENTVSLTHIFFFWKYQLSSRNIVFLAMTFNCLFWCLLIAGRLTHRRGFRRAAMVCLIPAIIFILTAAFNYYEVNHQRRGIVLAEKVSIRSGLEETSTELFVLHAGARIEVVKQMKNHFQIRFSKDKIGWLTVGAVGLI